jgi:isopentenyl-diphosphate delta-isomerase type 1
MTEMFDVVDENDKVIDRKSREECHSDPSLIHRSAAVMIFNKEEKMFLQKRSQTKDLYPGCWQVSAAGHLDPGESYDDAANRELKEELGVDTELKQVTKFLKKAEKETEIVVSFVGFHDGPFKLAEDEVVGGEFLGLEDIEKMVSKSPENFTPTSVIVIKKIGETVHDTVAVVAEDKGRFLLIKKAKGLADGGEWAFPGGHADEGETVYDAAKREGNEEVGEIEIMDEEPFLVFQHYVLKTRSGPHKHRVHVFRAGVSEVKTGSDAEGFEWFTKEEILENPKVQKWTKDVVRRI